MYYVAHGICRRADCSYKHEKPPLAESLPTSLPTAKVCTTTTPTLPAHRTLRCPAFQTLRLEIDTGCNHSLITHTAALHLQQYLPDATINLIDPVSFTTASHEHGLQAHCVLDTTLTVLDSSGTSCEVSWSPYITHLPLAGFSDGLLGLDLINFD
ncbi:hypothetical protein Pmar_PMAR011618 [Perkinsus marinus ATCC 50983]|uniref:Uncharacterized protein n=1 Tax=Perkinsus marinus (strain ATCC 50983 / TXsc) TaxID=423536 RepID=C5LCA4_PERM5|nr:hypothetical protein Pmar_PMAR011618 [Perkinsus marinus ATCC 50983]EER05587.1 hypothetical protein Pmar_PMAR011618 [Perkinsus marinus ATCC 50983]|eukprot:XP_002773771.1 hypothetical protein Pmar_PMAR011618 [Perkinsus marinus ATCC 50983]